MDARSKELILTAMQHAKGDDLERARCAFSGQATEQMQEQYGQSGCTRQEIIDGYVAQRSEWETAWAELHELLAK